MTAWEVVRAVQAGSLQARQSVAAALSRIQATDERVNAFTRCVAERAQRQAARIDALAPAERQRLPLAGVPFAVKNLFDVQGEITLAGSRIEREYGKAAARDALLVQRLEAAGAILVGMLNMDEYAYGFTTENLHYGATRNPHDLERISGGSSGGSAAAVAAGQVPLSLGTDTSGSVRVPASLCGVYGLKPTFGRLPRDGIYPLAYSLDHAGVFARDVTDLALAYDVMQGDGTPAASTDGSWAGRAPEPVSALLEGGTQGLRIAVLGGYFKRLAGSQALAALEHVAKALGGAALPEVELPGAEAARAAAYLLTNAQSAQVHLHSLRNRPDEFEPINRDRLFAGALLPAAWLERAHRLRGLMQRRAAELLAHYDVLLAPATPYAATPLGTQSLLIDGKEMMPRTSLGVLTQPISLLGLPVCTVPVFLPQELPIGVQVISAPWREDHALRVAAQLEREGIVRAPVAQLDAFH